MNRLIDRRSPLFSFAAAIDALLWQVEQTVRATIDLNRRMSSSVPCADQRLWRVKPTVSGGRSALELEKTMPVAGLADQHSG